MKNGVGDEVHFKLLKFPFKIVEDVSLNFQITGQPSSQETINELINSTGFFFNDNVEIELGKTKDSLKITRFDPKILNKLKVKGSGLTESVAIIAIDKHGKEIKLFTNKKSNHYKELLLNHLKVSH
ncbi:MAG: hypothetical protein SVY10_00320 [Thermodesulfobacteriota bacterium]|nr:hypothetical protein [Thermodesulfobacteriota bacterium]